MSNPERISRLIEDYIEEFELDLTDMVVYTEAATGAFAATAPTAAAAGAEHIYAIAADSPYGEKEDAFKETQSIASILGKEDVITYVGEKKPSDINECDIITNTGFVRPIDAEAVSWMSPNTVVPLMYEPWEFREEDVDLHACWQNLIPVVGTNESYENIRTFGYIGHAVQKVAYETNIEVLNCTFVVIGGGLIAAEIVGVLEQAGATVVTVLPDTHDVHQAGQLDFDFDSLDELAASDCVAQADALIVADHRSEQELISTSSGLDPTEIGSRNPALVLIHVCGNVDIPSLEVSGLNVVPRTPRSPGYMTFNAGYVGPQPIVALHTAGLKTGEILVRSLNKGNDFKDAVAAATEYPFVSGFPNPYEETFGYDG
jgi:hypothetical protein